MLAFVKIDAPCGGTSAQSAPRNAVPISSQHYVESERESRMRTVEFSGFLLIP